MVSLRLLTIFVLVTSSVALSIGEWDFAARLRHHCARRLPKAKTQDWFNGNLIWTVVSPFDGDYQDPIGNRSDAVNSASLPCNFRDEKVFSMGNGDRCLPGAPCFRQQVCNDVYPKQFLPSSLACSKDDSFRNDDETAFVDTGVNCYGLRAYQRLKVQVKRCRVYIKTLG